MLLLDEPLAGLAAAERERVSSLVKNVAAGIPVLIVEHDIDRVLGFSQNVTVMNQGEVLMTGTPAEVRADRRVQEVYTGTGTPPATRRNELALNEKPLLSFQGVNAFYGKSHILNDATPRRARGRDRRAARAQRRGQDHAAEDAMRPGAGRLRNDRLRGSRHHGACPRPK